MHVHAVTVVLLYGCFPLNIWDSHGHKLLCTKQSSTGIKYDYSHDTYTQILFATVIQACSVMC